MCRLPQKNETRTGRPEQTISTDVAGTMGLDAGGMGVEGSHIRKGGERTGARRVVVSFPLKADSPRF